MTEPHTTTFADTVTTTYQQVVGASDPDDGTTTTEAFAEAEDRILDRIRSGELVIDERAAVRAALKRADDSQGRSADTVIRLIVRGQHAVIGDDDPMLDTVVKLGEGKRKPLRNITARDYMEMDRLRYKNVRTAQESYSEWRDDFNVGLPALVQFGMFGSAATAGAFTQGEVAA